MPTFTTTRTYQDNSGLNQAMLDTAFNSIETFFNATKLGTDNLQTNAVTTSNIAPGAVTSTQLAALAVTLASLASDVTARLCPAGTINIWPTATAPTGWLLCDGSAVSRTTYANLYSNLGGASSIWGQGDGSTTFNLPNFAGRALVGAGSGSGLTGRALGATFGEENHTLTVSEIPSHHHALRGTTGTNSTCDGLASGADSIAGRIQGATGYYDGNPYVQDTGGGAAHNNVPPSIAVNTIIKT